ncbi:AAA family ATPase [Pseudolysinimonas sp.]|jgi:ABC-type cobalamin/Fe3+-siderophores transport system ATPase subunit|uniref:AAA family ATPase n=1 Tax=Pseudolysinimonas sp. TaxID=2680009 RepID=UPI003784F8A9
MRIYVARVGETTPTVPIGDFLLEPLIWNDWFEFRTLYRLSYVDNEGELDAIGPVKIGSFSHEYENTEEARTPLPDDFSRLSADFVSVGQDIDYYTRAVHLLGGNRAGVLFRALRDMAYNPELLERAEGSRILYRSLLRSVPVESVKKQYNRVAHGGDRLVPYDFSYSLPGTSERAPDLRLEVQVTPQSFPPTNVHVIIGRNNAGKTRLLRAMGQTLLGMQPEQGQEPGEFLGDFEFANVVFVSFSAFDPFTLPMSDGQINGLRYAYVGLHEEEEDEDDEGTTFVSQRTRLPDELADVFADSASIILASGLAHLWRGALATLETDPNFEQADVTSLADLEARTVKAKARRLFKKLSSGHKIVLLTITRLVEAVVEQTIVLLDEPEAHLHPPLLAAFVRALSDLMQERNGIAIAATHSPVILQEAPATCVSIIRRTGPISRAERPTRETFGENVGVLTHDVFGLEVTKSGFHRMLIETAEDLPSYDAVLEKFDQQVGGEGRAILRAWYAARRQR